MVNGVYDTVTHSKEPRKKSKIGLVAAILAILSIFVFFILSHHTPLKISFPHTSSPHKLPASGPHIPTFNQSPIAKEPLSTFSIQLHNFEKKYIRPHSYLTYLYPSHRDCVPIVRARLNVIMSLYPQIFTKYSIYEFPPYWLPHLNSNKLQEIVCTPRGLVYIGPLSTLATLNNSPLDIILHSPKSVVIIYNRSTEGATFAVQFWLKKSGVPVAIFPINSSLSILIFKTMRLSPRSCVVFIDNKHVYVYSATALLNYAREIERLTHKTFTPDSATLFVAKACPLCQLAEKLLSKEHVRIVDVTRTVTDVTFVPTLRIKLWNGRNYSVINLEGFRSIKSRGIDLLRAFGI